MEGPGLAAVLGAPGLGGAGLQLAAVVKLKQVDDQVADDVVLLGTIVYHCTGHCTYFDTMCINPILYPTSQKLIDELGVEACRGCQTQAG